METELKEYGLSDKEVKVFIANQKLGPSTANQLAEKARVIRTTTYEILQSLKQKGLVSSFKKDKKTFFESISPQQLISLLIDKQRKIERIIPELEKIRNSPKEKKPDVQLFIGQEGIKAVLENIIENKIPYLTYANADVFEKLNYYFPNFIKRRVKLKIPVRVIEEETILTKKHKLDSKKEYRQIRFSPVRFSATAFIYGENVLFLDLADEELKGILIKDKRISDMQREVFEILWKNSKR